MSLSASAALRFLKRPSGARTSFNPANVNAAALPRQLLQKNHIHCLAGRSSTLNQCSINAQCLETQWHRQNFSTASRAKKNKWRPPRGKQGEQVKPEIAKKTKPKRATQKKKKKKAKQQQFQLPTKGRTGRPIMTEAKWNKDAFVALLNLDLLGNHPKNILHIAQQKLQYTQHIDHEAVGPMFMATTTTQFGADVMMNHNNNAKAAMNKDGQVELVCSGLGRSKKWAEFYAAVDLIAALKECGIDAKNPPDIKAMRQQQEEELFKTRLARAQMVLELLGSSRPKFEHEQQPRGKWVAEMSLWVRGTFLTLKGPLGNSKAQAEGLALVEMVKGKDLADLVTTVGGRNIMEQYEAVIDASPGQHVAALRIPPLPDQVVEDMEEVMGTLDGKHDLRMEQHARVKEEYEAKFRHHHPTRKQQPRPRSGSRIQHINKGLREEELRKVEKIARNPEGKQGKMMAIRKALPITKIRQDLLKALKTEQVVVVSGGTGSGKSTQCPQYILEEAIMAGRGANTEIIATQPRKIAAISVAERVAAERDERIGNSVGYTVRFKRKAPREAGGTIEFVTTGVLLRRLVNDPTLTNVSCVMIDEVHERDINTDFLLILLRDLLEKRLDLRVVLMSATLNAESFANYFSSQQTVKDQKRPVKVLSVPTEPRHPVEVSYLEDMADDGDDDHFPAEMQELAKSLLQYHDEKLRIELEEAESEASAAAQLEARSNAEDEGLLLESDSDDSDSDSENSSDDSYVDRDLSRQNVPSTPRIETLKRAVSLRSGAAKSTGALTTSLDSNPTTRRAQAREAEDSIVRLVAKLALYLGKVETDSGRNGSILCFLPGWDEIKEATALLEDEADAELRGKMSILPLHSTIPQDDQQKVFEPAADGTVKVILATNIAESSVTINDVLAVVDGGLVRELNWDAESAMSTMDTVATSRASATQRLGRAGRVAPGRCYRLYSRGAFEAMSERPAPEIQRTALEATCLQTCSMTRDGVEKFLSRAMDPPQEDAVSYAVDRLVKLGALRIDSDAPSGGQILTPLGRCLSRLPLDPAMGKMLIMGAVMRCLDPVLTTAACFSSRNTFYNPPGMRDEAQEIRKSFSHSSDTMAQVMAYDEFWDIVENGEGWDYACSWARDNYVSVSALISIKAVRSQLIEELRKIGLVEGSDLEKEGYKKYVLRSDAVTNQNADNEMLHTAVLAIGLPGNLSSRRQLGSFGTLRTRMDDHAGLHPSSVTFHRKPPKARGKLPSWYLYREMVLSSQVFLRECTTLTPEQIVLFGGYSLDSIEKQHHSINDAPHSTDILDNWIVVESSCDDTMSLLTSARRDINAALEYKVIHPRNPLPDESQSVIDGICDMFDVLYYERNTSSRDRTRYR